MDTGDTATNGASSTDGSLTLRAWARSRGIPNSTAHKAAKTGRISRRPDGRVDPKRADAEWALNTRPRIDGRVPAPLTPEMDLVSLRTLARPRTEPGVVGTCAEEFASDPPSDPDWCGDEGDDIVSVRVAQIVED